MLFSNNFTIIHSDLYAEKLLRQKLTFASLIVDATFNYFQIERIDKKLGKKPWDLKNMMKMLHFATIEKIENSEDIANRVVDSKIYNELCNGIDPKARTIRDYKKNL